MVNNRCLNLKSKEEKNKLKPQGNGFGRMGRGEFP